MTMCKSLDMYWVLDNITYDVNNRKNQKDIIITIHRDQWTGELDYSIVDVPEDLRSKLVRGKVTRSLTGSEIVVSYVPLATNCTIETQLLMFQDKICDELGLLHIDWEIPQ